MTQELLTLTNTFKDPLLKGLKSLKEDIKYFFDDGLLPYLDNMQQKYLFTKTFLYRNENVYFYDTYFPISIEESKKSKIKSNNIKDIFKDSHFISIIGNAGSGKSMLLKFIFLESIRDIIKIPIIIELRNLNDFKGSINDFISQIIFNNRLSPNNKILEKILNDGNILFLLDGFDEIYSEHKGNILNDLESFIDRYSNNTYIISSRPGAYLESLPRFVNVNVIPLEINETKDFINLQLKDPDGKKLSKRIIEEIDKNENKDYLSYLSSPLLLSMFILTFNSYPILPNSKNKFYWNVFDTLIAKHDSITKKGGFQHERKSGLSIEDFEKLLKWFSYISFFEGKYVFDNQYLVSQFSKIKDKLFLKCDVLDIIYDLVVSIGILIADGLEFTFPHRSLQEYFTALLIKDQTITDKVKIYDKQFEKLAWMSMSSNENFWNLCSEIDKISFYKFFILKNLDQFINDVNSDNPNDLLKKLLIKLKYRVEIKISGENFKSIDTHFDKTIISEIFGFLNFDFLRKTIITIGLDSQIEFLNYFTNYTFINSNEKNINNNYARVFSIYFDHNWDNDFINLFAQNGFTKFFNDFFSLLTSKYNEIIKEIEIEEKNNIDLLDI